MQHPTQSLGEDFLLVEKSIWEDFIMAIFHGVGFHIPVLEVTIIPVKQAGIDLLDPILTAQKNWTDNVLSQDTWWNLCGGGFSYGSGNTPYC